jgi:hypothetical protein
LTGEAIKTAADADFETHAVIIDEKPADAPDAAKPGTATELKGEIFEQMEQQTIALAQEIISSHVLAELDKDPEGRTPLGTRGTIEDLLDVYNQLTDPLPKQRQNLAALIYEGLAAVPLSGQPNLEAKRSALRQMQQAHEAVLQNAAAAMFEQAGLDPQKYKYDPSHLWPDMVVASLCEIEGVTIDSAGRIAFPSSAQQVITSLARNGQWNDSDTILVGRLAHEAGSKTTSILRVATTQVLGLDPDLIVDEKRTHVIAPRLARTIITDEAITQAGGERTPAGRALRDRQNAVSLIILSDLNARDTQVRKETKGFNIGLFAQGLFIGIPLIGQVLNYGTVPEQQEGGGHPTG